MDLTPKRKTAVVEDLEGFLAWLATTPFVLAACNKPAQNSAPGGAAPAAGPDPDLLAALKSMA